jgi:hypothetical protein
MHGPVARRLLIAAAVLAAAVLAVLAVLAAGAAAAPIDDPNPTSLPPSMGAPATASAFPATVAPQNPFLAPDPASNIHDDTWMTDAYPSRPGPLGRDLQTSSGALPPALCGSLAFDSAGRIVSVCVGSVTGATAHVIDPDTLAILSSYRLPGGGRELTPGVFQNFTGGGYFFLDGRDRIWSAARNNHLVVVAERDDGRRLVKVGDYDLSRRLLPSEGVTSALPDFHGNVWFVSKQRGVIGVLKPATRRIATLRLGEEVENSFAVGRDGIYVVSDQRMYRFSLHGGRPKIDWSVAYANSGIHKPSQLDAGSGTTPTLMTGGYVAITDNADPMNVVVYRTAGRLAAGQRRTVCTVPVFAQGANATENSLITSGRSLFVENNYGYQDPFFGPAKGSPTTPGFARVDVAPDGSGCRLVWSTDQVQASTVVPKLSAVTGLIYVYERLPAPDGEQPWYWTAIDAHTGQVAWRRYAGSGLAFNNNYAGIALGRDGSAYLGVFGGLLRLRDGGS